MITGAALGAAAIQGLHAQAKPKAILVTESEVLDRAAVPPYGSVLTPAMQAAGVEAGFIAVGRDGSIGVAHGTPYMAHAWAISSQPAIVANMRAQTE
jgi:isoaspartyl peptidase/L-asparaginase-like protein (Ntn-hydrolase superfamily)